MISFGGSLMRRLAMVTTLLLLASVSRADQTTLDESSKTGLQQTQAMMMDPKAVQDYAKDQPEAARANSNLESLTGGNAEDQAAIYKLASEIFGNMVTESGGDAAGMSNSLAQAMKNPQAFANKLTPEQQQQLKSLSQRIESRAPGSAPH